jgi:hypothetical protein
MKRQERATRWGVGIVLIALGWPLHAAEATRPGAADAPAATRAEQHVQAWLGGIDTDEHWQREDPDTGAKLDGGFGTLPYVGGAGQRLFGHRLQAGFEGGGLVAWKNDSTRFFASNSSAAVEIDNELFSIELFLGGMVSLRPARWLRLYAAAGPTVAYAHLIDDGGDHTSTTTSTAITAGSGGNAYSATLYGRAGFEFETTRGFTFGAHARYAPHEFDFDDSGTLKLDGVQYFLSLGQRL